MNLTFFYAGGLFGAFALGVVYFLMIMEVLK